MADTKVSALTALSGANLAAGDLFYVIDVSEAVAADRSKSIRFDELFTQSPVNKYLSAVATLTMG